MIPVPSGVSGLGHRTTSCVCRAFRLLKGTPGASITAVAGSSASGGGGIKAASKPLSKLFQISGCFRQSFPTKALAVLWDFKGLQGSQAKKYRLPNFSSPPAPFAHIPNAPTPHSAARRGYRFRTANRDFQILVLRTAPPDLDPGKLEVFKKQPGTNCVFPKQRTLARLASKIEHRVVVGPESLDRRVVGRWSS